MKELPQKYTHSDIEKKWQDTWDSNQTYQWDPNATRQNIFAVDTPPPTVSGSLHVGHVFSYTHTDIITRYQRMTGKTIFYPMGWDDNGLPTERRVQNVYGITCNPHIPYQENWAPTKQEESKKKETPAEEVSRKNFIEACQQLTKEDEKAFESLWKQLGLSVDWNLQYATIDPHCQKISQLSFLDLVEKNQVYQQEAPCMWDVDFQTAVAQAELEDRDQESAYHDIRFSVQEDGSEFIISTTRPELLPACIAVVAHPDDKRYQHLFGKTAITPLFYAPVPILSATHADPEKGSGILMVCTFGDINDVQFWKQSKLPLKQILNRNGHLADISFGSEPFTSLKPDLANKNYQDLNGCYVKKARKLIAEKLAHSDSSVDQNKSALFKDPQPITHPVKFYEKGARPIEFMSTRQWYIRILDHKEALLKQGEKIQWHPTHMKSRYQNWVSGLNQDWCISRQRFFGVPFPVWYKRTASGEVDYNTPIFATKDQLPVDPMSDCPIGYTPDQRDQPNGFSGDPDVMDTWATSSLTPQIASHWGLNEQRHQSIFPMDLRPQSHEIIRTWAFYTIVKAYFHNQDIPFKHVGISGWILDPDRKKMSKSKGNVVTPHHLLEKYSADGVRYWAARARLGVDTAFDETIFQVGQRLSNKLFNASKFVLMQIRQSPGPLSPHLISETMDQAYIAHLNQMIENATAQMQQFDYAAALDKIESGFWDFCDNYLELVKTRSYQQADTAAGQSALATLQLTLDTFLKLLAPYQPYITEEIWSWQNDNSSIHRSPWPKPTETNTTADAYNAASEVLAQIRGIKSEQNLSIKTPITQLGIACNAFDQALLESVIGDILNAGSVQQFHFEAQKEGKRFGIKAELDK